MNCDDVFDILTRGPFPTGAASDRAVERHLDGCEDCCRLAEALRPAVELFQETIGPEESRTLPSYWGTPVVSSELARQAFDYGDALTKVATASAARRGALSARRPPRALNAVRFAAAIGVGIVLALAIHGMTETRPSVAVAQSTDASRAGVAADKRERAAPLAIMPVEVNDVFGGKLSAGGRSKLLALSLASECRPMPLEHATAELPLHAADAVATVSLGHFQCCLNCHGDNQASSASMKRTMASQLANACLACHH